MQISKQLVVFLSFALLCVAGCAVKKSKSTSDAQSTTAATAAPSFKSADVDTMQSGARAIMNRTYTLRMGGDGTTTATQMPFHHVPPTQAAIAEETEETQQHAEEAIAIDQENSDHASSAAIDFEPTAEVEVQEGERIVQFRMSDLVGEQPPEEQAQEEGDEQEAPPFPASEAEAIAAHEKVKQMRAAVAEQPETTQTEDGQNEVATAQPQQDSVDDAAAGRAMLKPGSVTNPPEIEVAPPAAPEGMPFWMIALIVVLLGCALFGLLLIILNYDRSTESARNRYR